MTSARARKLRGERDESDGACVEESIEKLEIRIAAGSSWMDPQAQGREKRPFEMRAQDAGPVRRCRHLAEGGEELRLGSGDERRQESGHAGLEQSVARVAVPVGVGGEEVDSGEAVHLEVDEARDGDALAVRRREAEPGDTAPEDLDVARDERAVDESGFDAEPHGASSSARAMLPSDASSRARAVRRPLPRGATRSRLGHSRPRRQGPRRPLRTTLRSRLPRYAGRAPGASRSRRRRPP